MASVLIFPAEGPNPEGAPFVAPRDAVQLSRVPSVGEYLNLGNDEEGISGDYRVVLVQHAIDAAADAEIYVVRVNIADEIRAAAPTETWRKPGT